MLDDAAAVGLVIEISKFLHVRFYYVFVSFFFISAGGHLPHLFPPDKQHFTRNVARNWLLPTQSYGT